MRDFGCTRPFLNLMPISGMRVLLRELPRPFARFGCNHPSPHRRTGRACPAYGQHPAVLWNGAPPLRGCGVCRGRPSYNTAGKSSDHAPVRVRRRAAAGGDRRHHVPHHELGRFCSVQRGHGGDACGPAARHLGGDRHQELPDGLFLEHVRRSALHTLALQPPIPKLPRAMTCLAVACRLPSSFRITMTTRV